MTERDRDQDREPIPPGEDLSKGPTPETRHMSGGADDVRDTTEGPTPETRMADREAEMKSGEEPHASGQPDKDPRTRSDIAGGTQD